MQIQFMGAAGTVTGSSYILTSQSGKSIMIDLGMFQGTEEIESLNYAPYTYDCSKLSGALLTHAHLDHCGRLPLLLKGGFTGRIFMTAATRDLTELSLYDSAKIAKNFHKQILYDKDLVEETMTHCDVVEYHQQFQIEDFSILFRDAGHLLGAASIEITDTTDNKKIIFSGDLGNTPQDLLQTTEHFEHADIVVIESTYGDSLHPDEEAKDVLRNEIRTIEHSRGVLLIPAFSLERTQEILHLLMHLKQEQAIASDTPIIVDSPMAQKATEIYLTYTSLMNAHIQEDLKKGSIFDFPGLQVTHSYEDSEAIAELPGPKVIIAGGGMMTGGRIVAHAARYLPQETTRLLLVGYQGEETLGRELQEGAKRVMIEKQSIDVKAIVSSTRSMSSHADQKQLLEWLHVIRGVHTLCITHGEDPARRALAQKIQEEGAIQTIHLPVLHEERQV